uniref:Uncharacterized protein n=1 Tax=Siphoviridae sp. ctbxa26 TaxID=2825568 RepID=A0A8S5VEZ1_9CAUD|nr:MAG TPA: hypothetical protein [Siphoviridae sp. ctbxa26]
MRVMSRTFCNVFYIFSKTFNTYQHYSIECS